MINICSDQPLIVLLLRILLLLLLFFLAHNVLFAQHRIFGRVIDAETGEAVPNALIFTSDSTVSTEADINGEFSIIVTKIPVKLTFGFVGYCNNEIEINGTTHEYVIELQKMCLLDLFDTQRLGIYANTSFSKYYLPGIELRASTPTLLSSEYSHLWIDSKLIYQTNLGSISFFNTSFDFNGALHTPELNSNFSIDLSFINQENDLNLDIQQFYFTLDHILIPYTQVIFGYSFLQRNENIFSENLQGPILGFNSYLPFIKTDLVGKISAYDNSFEIRTKANWYFGPLNIFLSYHQFKTYQNLSVGVGFEFNYLLKDQKKCTCR